ncbi:hypothetical protein DPMN_083688 [Dreissena polymorpha]|uniref:SOCS box domain-containing protein n=1 Tax=Dreissena polymorpha TaxID=45954 RepID=A0A9D3Y988_DREPO|nr:hypothetical protein DPMN_083688 [Dreissena polymorpha]
MASITAGDVSAVKELLTKLDVRRLNKSLTADLKHTSRIKIRNCMKRFSPEICDGLPLPAELKEYLMIESNMLIAVND